MFEVRLNPTKTRIPKKQTDYRIINDANDARPTGICVFVGNKELANFGLVTNSTILHRIHHAVRIAQNFA